MPHRIHRVKDVDSLDLPVLSNRRYDAFTGIESTRFWIPIRSASRKESFQTCILDQSLCNTFTLLALGEKFEKVSLCRCASTFKQCFFPWIHSARHESEVSVRWFISEKSVIPSQATKPGRNALKVKRLPAMEGAVSVEDEALRPIISGPV